MKVLLSLLSVVSLFSGSTQQPCLDQQEVCECESGQTECNFKLTVEELQTFTSYVIESDDLISSRGTPGDAYYLDSTGYHPAISGTPAGLPEIGWCHNTEKVLVYGEDFEDAGRNGTECSVPMTVDGNTYRMFIAVNGRIPGPTLIVDEGAIVRVTVNNSLTSEGITIHWHGMHQKGTPWMDGVGFISQTPITPGATFDYVFEATPPGTHWYHSHVGAQRTDGLFGAFVVRERPPRTFEGEIVPELLKKLPDVEYSVIEDEPALHTMTLLDWQGEASLSLFTQIHSTLGFWENKPMGVVPNPGFALSGRTFSADKVEVGPVPFWSGLINGRGRLNSSVYSPLSVFTVQPNKAYRFRIIGAQSLYAYRFSIDNHKLQVIESDGHFIEPQEVHYLVVHSGERYDVIVDTHNQGQQELYWIRAETLETMRKNDREHSALAVLKYGENINDRDVDWRGGYSEISPIEHSCTVESKCDVLNCPFGESSVWNCIHLHDLTALSFPNDPAAPLWYDESTCGRDECLRFFNFGFEGVSDTSAVNAVNFKMPTTDYQTNCGQYNVDRENKRTCTDAFESRRCIHVAQIVQSQSLSSKKTVFMILSAVGDIAERFNNFSHPIHLHGHSFRVLYVGHGGYDEDGALTTNSPDVSCDNDRLCRRPDWNKEWPQRVLEASERLGDEIRVNKSRILKDTVIVPAGGYVAIAFEADNPGYWFLHCHIEVHQLEGMGVMIEEYPYTRHRTPPQGISKVGDFRLNISQFSELSTSTCKSREYNIAVIALGVAVGILFLICVVLLICCCYHCKSKNNNVYENLHSPT